MHLLTRLLNVCGTFTCIYRISTATHIHATRISGNVIACHRDALCESSTLTCLRWNWIWFHLPILSCPLSTSTQMLCVFRCLYSWLGALHCRLLRPIHLHSRIAFAIFFVCPHVYHHFRTTHTHCILGKPWRRVNGIPSYSRKSTPFLKVYTHINNGFIFHFFFFAMHRKKKKKTQIHPANHEDDDVMCLRIINICGKFMVFDGNIR